MTQILIRAAAATLALSLSAGLPAAAQPAGPPIRTMPLPPSAGDPPPKETGATPRASTQQKKPARAKPKTTEAEDGLVAPPAGRSAGARGASTSAGPGGNFQRPKRFVPEEFDRGGEDDTTRAKPFMSETGRPGVGMRF